LLDKYRPETASDVVRLLSAAANIIVPAALRTFTPTTSTGSSAKSKATNAKTIWWTDTQRTLRDLLRGADAGGADKDDALAVLDFAGDAWRELDAALAAKVSARTGSKVTRRAARNAVEAVKIVLVIVVKKLWS
jgi:hypothetical protein